MAAPYPDDRLDQIRRQRAERAASTAVDIRGRSALEAGELAFMGHSLVQLCLPHADPGDVPYYERRNGKLSLIVQPGIARENDETYSVGIPFGVYPRLVLAWITTEAVRSKSREIKMGTSLTAFMAEVGLTPGGETARTLRMQMQRLFTARIAVVEGSTSHQHQRSVLVSSESRLWWDVSGDEPLTLGSSVHLSDEFYRLVTERPVPLDMRALSYLKSSPLGLDLYMWLTYRMSYMQRETVIPWTALGGQFGAGYTDPKNFARAVKRELQRIRLVWPELRYETPRGRLVLKPGPPHVRQLRG